MTGPVEPHADIRAAAATMFQIYVAYVEAGFTTDQAMDIVKTIIQTQIIAASGKEEGDGS
jgi:hypothetical protein